MVARASGMDLASSLKRNTFLTLEVRPAGGCPPYRRSPKGRVGDGGVSPPIDGHPMCPARMTWGIGGVTGVEALGGGRFRRVPP